MRFSDFPIKDFKCKEALDFFVVISPNSVNVFGPGVIKSSLSLSISLNVFYYLSGEFF
jgi:hypothetical protein